MTSSTVARNIKANMAYIGVTASDMAKACKVSKRTWHRWIENPENITVSHLIIIAENLGASPSELFQERRKRKKK